MNQTVQVPAGTTINKQQECTLFLQMNYARYRLSLLREQLLGPRQRSRDARLALLAWDNKQIALRNQLATANLGLVFSVARRGHHYGVEFADLISEGSMALLRAINTFDCNRDIRFSTYAHRAISWAHMRLAKRCYRQHHLFSCTFDPEWHLDSQQQMLQQDHRDEWLEALRAVMAANAACLTPIEFGIVQQRFALNGASRGAMTLRDVGRQLGLSKERVRQIQNQALGKLREAVDQRTGSAR